MKLTISHETLYRFEPPMRGVVQSLRLTPSQFEGQQVIDWSIDVAGAERGAAFRDGAGDWVETVSVLGPVSEVRVVVRGTVITQDLIGVLKGHRETVPPEAYLRPTLPTEADMAVRALAESALESVENDDPLARAHALASAVTDAIAYCPGETNPGTSAAEALALGRGVCQDHTHALIAVAQASDIPARYVTGYLESGADGGAHEASHAWAELWVHGIGWIGFDAANACCPDERYVRIGSGHDAQDAAPIRGVAAGIGVEALEVDVHVDDTTADQGQSQTQQ
ncbi:transglutaminase family protein [Oceaniglobus ichthyenteri]|uniref:transglutaminase family protein n=1 Tax=Oceaniglobus ichthyenteri TaxID=2136177 RepID=UPI000D38093D|nr:transglutaminase family protein [Oceaniglobus ichthyenteri]